MRSYKESMNQIVMPDALKERIRRQAAAKKSKTARPMRRRRYYTVCANIAACLLLLLCTQMHLSDVWIAVLDAQPPENSAQFVSSTVPQPTDAAEPQTGSAQTHAPVYRNSAAPYAAAPPNTPETTESTAADSVLFRFSAVSADETGAAQDSGSLSTDMAATAIESGSNTLETAETTDSPNEQKKSTQTAGSDSPPLLQSPHPSASSAGGTVSGTGFTESIPTTGAASATPPQTEQQPPTAGSGGGGGKLPNELYSAKKFMSLADLRAVCGFAFRVPAALPEGCTLSDIALLSGNIVQLTYDGAMPFTFRAAHRTGDVSGDYNDYDETTVQRVGTLSVSLHSNAGLVYTATWQDAGVCYALVTDGISQDKLLSLIAGMQ